MIDVNQRIKASMNNQDVVKSMIQEQKDITDNIKSYLSKTDKFSVRMSAAR